MKQYLALVQHKKNEGSDKWTNALFYTGTSLSQRYFNDERSARAAIEKCLKMFNKEYVYDKNGQRQEYQHIGNGLYSSLVLTKDMDNMDRIVAWKIKCREVTPWDDIAIG